MASKKTLNGTNLEALGAKRLAELLLEISAGNAAAKRLLRLELAGAESPSELAKEIRKRLAAIARSRVFFDWQNQRTLVDDLDTQRSAIADRVAKSDPALGLNLMWSFLDLAPSVFDRCDDSNGTVSGIFDDACTDLGDIAQAAHTAPRDLADQAFQALFKNDYGQFDTLIDVLTPALGQQGLEHLKQRMIARASAPVQRPADKDRKAIAWGSSRGPVYADEVEESSRISTVKLALQEIADAQGDVDAFIAQHDKPTRKMPGIAVGIARRLLAAGRPKDALQIIDAAEHSPPGWVDGEWDNARIDVLDALGRADEAQAARLARFVHYLSAPHLRAYLKRLADFDDVEAEDRALDSVERHTDLHHALAFLIDWPSLDRAARMVMQRPQELDGNRYDVLPPAADALIRKYPLAATLVLRAMVDFTLAHSKASRYRHAACHLIACGSLASKIGDFGSVQPHEAYLAQLRRDHPRKSSFWTLTS